MHVYMEVSCTVFSRASTQTPMHTMLSNTGVEQSSIIAGAMQYPIWYLRSELLFTFGTLSTAMKSILLDEPPLQCGSRWNFRC